MPWIFLTPAEWTTVMRYADSFFRTSKLFQDRTTQQAMEPIEREWEDTKDRIIKRNKNDHHS